MLEPELCKGCSAVQFSQEADIMGSFTAFLGGSLIIAIFSIHNSKLWQIFPQEVRSQGGETSSDELMKMDMQELLEFATKTIGKVN